MRQSTRVSVAALAVVALALVSASTALAAQPEYGRCVNLGKGGGGRFKNSGCTEAVASGGKFEWMSGPGAKPGFISEAKVLYTIKYRYCRSAAEEERLAEEERQQAATAPEPLKGELIGKAEEHEAAAQHDYRKADLDKEECATLIESEEGKAPAVLETAHLTRVRCGEVSVSGQFSGPTSDSNVIVKLSECADNGVSCQSAEAEEGAITSSTLSGALGIISEKRGKLKAGVDLAPSPGEPFAEFSCGGTQFVVDGSVIREVSSNKMLTLEDHIFAQSRGVDKLRAFLGGEEDVLTGTVGEGSPESIGLELKGEQVSEEALEVNTAV